MDVTLGRFYSEINQVYYYLNEAKFEWVIRNPHIFHSYRGIDAPTFQCFDVTWTFHYRPSNVISLSAKRLTEGTQGAINFIVGMKMDYCDEEVLIRNCILIQDFEVVSCRCDILRMVRDADKIMFTCTIFRDTPLWPECFTVPSSITKKITYDAWEAGLPTPSFETKGNPLTIGEGGGASFPLPSFKTRGSPFSIAQRGSSGFPLPSFKTRGNPFSIAQRGSSGVPPPTFETKENPSSIAQDGSSGFPLLSFKTIGNPFSVAQRGSSGKNYVSREAQTVDVPHAKDRTNEELLAQDSEVQLFLENFHSLPKQEGSLQEVLEGVQWRIGLPPLQKHWETWSPSFNCGEIRCRLKLYNGGSYSEGLYLRFCIKVPSDAAFPLQLGWLSGVQMGDGAGIRWLMAGKKEVKGQCNLEAQQVRMRRAELEGWLSADSRLTFVHQVNVGGLCTEALVYAQTEEHGIGKIQVSCETQTEDETVEEERDCWKEKGQTQVSCEIQTEDEAIEEEQGSQAVKGETQVSCETQTENESVEEERDNQNIKELQERRLHLRMWLQNPSEGDRIRQLRREKFEANWEKSLLKLSSEEKEPVLYASRPMTLRSSKNEIPKTLK